MQLYWRVKFFIRVYYYNYRFNSFKLYAVFVSHTLFHLKFDATYIKVTHIRNSPSDDHHRIQVENNAVSHNIGTINFAQTRYAD